MGLVYAEITLENSVDAVLAERGKLSNKDIKKIEVRALVDSGAAMLTINDTLAKQLDLGVLDSATIELADGTHSKRELAGPVTIRFKNRMACCSALVLPGANEVLLGAIPLEAMDVIIDPLAEQLIVHPDRPHIAQIKIK